MDFKDNQKTRANNTTITRNIYEFSNLTGNIYESVAVLSKRSNQIAQEMKRELHKKIDDFASNIDTMEEIYENREQIEVVRHFEQMPKPTLQATQEYLDGELYYRNPAKEDKNMQKLEAMENEVIAETDAAPEESAKVDTKE